MSKKYSLAEVRDNLEKLYDKLESKGREDGFWVIASRSDFKPLKLYQTIKGKEVSKTIVRMDDIKKELLEGKEQYFKGKKLAFIHFYIDKIYLKNSKEYNEQRLKKIKDVILSGLLIDIFVIDKDGKINNDRNYRWRCKINFTVDDMINFKLKFKDAETLMRQVANEVVTTGDFAGINFKDYMKKYKKNIKKI